MKKRTSIKDVAQKANVSTALVSYVLNDKHINRISKETAERVRKAAKELNYRPNKIAQSLKLNKTNTIGLIVRDITNKNTGQLIQFIEDELTEKNYVLLIRSSNYNLDKQKRIINSFLNHQVDGIIVQPAENSDNDLLQANLPIVLLDHYIENSDIPVVTTNNFGSSYQAMEIIVKESKKSIGIITFQSELLHIKERIKGIENVAEKYKISLDVSYIKDVATVESEIEIIIEELVNKKNIETLFFISHNLAIIGLKKITQLKLNKKITILTFDESDTFEISNYPVIYIKQPIEQVAVNSVEVILEMINNKGYKPKNRIYNSRIIKNNYFENIKA